MKNQKISGTLLILAFIAIYFIWGTTYLANLFALQGIKPFVLSSLRYLVAGLLLAVWAIFKRLSWPDAAMIKVLSIGGIIMLIGGSGLVVYAEQYINSGSAAVVIATEPLWFVLLDKKRWKQYFSNSKVITGLLVGFVGIALFSHFSPVNHPEVGQADHQLLGTMIVLVSSVLWVAGTLYTNKRLKQGSSHLINTSVQLLAAGIFAALLALFNGEWHYFYPTKISMQAWAGLLFLIIMGSLAAYLAFTWLVTVRPPAVVSTHTFVNPVVAILVGWLISGEQVGLKQVFALAIVLAGVVLTQNSKEAELQKL